MVEFDLSKDAITTGLTSTLVDYLLTASSYCLDKNNHETGVQATITGGVENVIKLSWAPISQEVENTYADPGTATERGAEGLAFIIVDRLTEYQVGMLSYVGTGFDYYLVAKDVAPSLQVLSQGYMKLEVSGIDKKTAKNTVDSRVRMKCKQAATHKDGIDYMVVVAEFSEPLVEVRYGTSN